MLLKLLPGAVVEQFYGRSMVSVLGVRFSRGEVECDEDGQGLFIFLRSWAAAAAALNTCDVILFFMTVHYQGRNREGRFFYD